MSKRDRGREGILGCGCGCVCVCVCVRERERERREDGEKQTQEADGLQTPLKLERN